MTELGTKRYNLSRKRRRQHEESFGSGAASLCGLALSACGEQPEEPGIYEPGTGVTLGSYEQDNDPDNGPEPIDWIVLECHGNRALLVSKYALETMPYYTASRTAVTWETSELRVWLNGSFWETAFTPEEQAMILTT